MTRWVVFGVVLLLAGCRRSADEAPYSGTIEFPDVSAGSLVGGRVLSVEKQEGEAAEAGAALVHLDPEEWEGALEEAKSLAQATARELDLMIAGPRVEEIAQAKAEARRLELLWQIVTQGARPEEIAAAREDLAAAEALLREADARLEREKSLSLGGTTTKEALERAISDRENARARTAATLQRVHLLERGARPEEAEAARMAHVAQGEFVHKLEAGARPEELAAKRATLEAAEARIRVAKSKLSELTIRAPAPCFVQTLDIRPGDLLRAGEPVALLLLRERPWILVYVPEAHLARVRLGQKATAVPDGHPPVDGEVTWISRSAEFTPRNVQTREERTTQVFAVRVTLSGDTSLLKDGMWADVTLR